MKSHTPKSATYTIYLSTDSFQLQPGALGEVSNTRVHARLKKRGGGRKTGIVGPQYPRP